MLIVFLLPSSVIFISFFLSFLKSLSFAGIGKLYTRKRMKMKQFFTFHFIVIIIIILLNEGFFLLLFLNWTN